VAKVGSKGRVLDGGERDRGGIFNFALLSYFRIFTIFDDDEDAYYYEILNLMLLTSKYYSFFLLEDK
jgi:hypothetical protein